MPMRKKIATIAISAIVLLVGFDSLAPTVYSYRPGSPMLPLIVLHHHGTPQEWIARLIEYEGGLPKTGVMLTHYNLAPGNPGDIGYAAPVDVYAVERWEIERTAL